MALEGHGCRAEGGELIELMCSVLWLKLRSAVRLEPMGWNWGGESRSMQYNNDREVLCRDCCLSCDAFHATHVAFATIREYIGLFNERMVGGRELQETVSIER